MSAPGADRPGVADPGGKDVAVIGAGHVGLVVAAGLATLGHRVTGVDVDAERVGRLAGGELPILEPGLGDAMRAAMAAGRLRWSIDADAAIAGAEFVFLCVATPGGADGSADLGQVKEAARRIAGPLRAGAVVVLKSTAPVGAAEAVLAALARQDVAVVCNPEFLREGTAFADWLRPDRIVVGAADPAAAERVAALYRGVGAPIVVTDPISAELAKYASNAFLATKVSFANSLETLSRRLGARTDDVLAVMGLDRRIGADHLRPGPGWGGSCFEKDTSALLRMAEHQGLDLPLVREAVSVNEQRIEDVVATVVAAVGGLLAGQRVAVWGLTFKAGTDDLRASPAVAALRRLVARGAHVTAYDPSDPRADHAELGSLKLDLVDDARAACEGAAVLVVLTEWPEFAAVGLAGIAEVMERPLVVDTRGVLDPGALAAAGLRRVPLSSGG